MNRENRQLLMPVGRWGRLHLDYIKNNEIDVFNELIGRDNLCEYLKNIEEEAQNKFEKLVEELDGKQNIALQSTEFFKLISEEIVLQDIIYKLP